MKKTRYDISFLMKVFSTMKSSSEKERMRDESGYPVRPPPKRLKVFCFITGRRGERDLNAIVDVKSKYWQMKAIELLDEQAYDHNIIKVEKAKPTKKRWSWLIY